MPYFTHRSILTVLIALITVPWHGQAEAQSKDKKDAPRPASVMVRKLEHAKALLRGLAVQDFDLLVKNSEALNDCRQETTWKLNQTEKYVFYSNQFGEQLDRLKAAAKKKDIEGSTLAYLEVARTCVACHEQLRPGAGGKKDD